MRPSKFKTFFARVEINSYFQIGGPLIISGPFLGSLILGVYRVGLGGLYHIGLHPVEVAISAWEWGCISWRRWTQEGN